MDLTDVKTRQDIIALMVKFYEKAKKDEIIGVKFEHLNLDHHIEIIADFWDSVIFGTNRYQGDPFGKHLSLQLQNIDFDRWLALFTSTVDNLYQGKNADEMKHRANTIAQIFRHKLKLQ